MNGILIPEKKKTIKQNFELFLNMFLKFEIISMRIDRQVIRLQNNINFLETPRIIRKYIMYK